MTDDDGPRHVLPSGARVKGSRASGTGRPSVRRAAGRDRRHGSGRDRDSDGGNRPQCLEIAHCHKIGRPARSRFRRVRSRTRARRQRPGLAAGPQTRERPATLPGSASQNRTFRALSPNGAAPPLRYIAGIWSYQVPTLLSAGYRAIVIDSRGHGRSTRDDRPYSYERMASDVLAVMDALGVDSARLASWSDGACIALVLAARAPSPCRGRVLLRAQHGSGAVRRRWSRAP